MEPKRSYDAKVSGGLSVRIAEQITGAHGTCIVVRLDAFQAHRESLARDASRADSLQRVLENAKKLNW